LLRGVSLLYSVSAMGILARDTADSDLNVHGENRGDQNDTKQFVAAS